MIKSCIIPPPHLPINRGADSLSARGFDEPNKLSVAFTFSALQLNHHCLTI
ncbi:MAG: hypothetical protein LBB43_06600 [Spirochaetaceae bacterium]|nr:hypothetical protein [Spirochaetaceae bacterium]